MRDDFFTRIRFRRLVQILHLARLVVAHDAGLDGYQRIAATEDSQGRDLQPDRPLRVLMIGPFVEHDPAVTPEVQKILVVGMGPGQAARPDLVRVNPE